ncbi:hypothetical protein EC991_010665 [Linnemannia zychae]|nr:hypothetical protein EC991_010665 [Linnemannia zychae]
MSNSLCCGIFFREPKVWLIEISLRECQLDEYALMVPSPVYCDYRLPGYDDAMAGAAGGVTGAGATGEIVAAASSSRTALNRHNGLPPAYENESDSGEDDDDFDEDEDEDDDLENDNTHAHSQIQGSLECQLMRPTPAHFSDNGFSSSSNSSMDSAALHSQPEMEMIQRPIDMTSVVVLSAPLPTTAAGTPSLSVLPSPSYGSTSNSSHEYTHDFGRMPESSTSSPSINEQP